MVLGRGGGGSRRASGWVGNRAVGGKAGGKQDNKVLGWMRYRARKLWGGVGNKAIKLFWGGGYPKQDK